MSYPTAMCEYYRKNLLTSIKREINFSGIRNDEYT